MHKKNHWRYWDIVLLLIGTFPHLVSIIHVTTVSCVVPNSLHGYNAISLLLTLGKKREKYRIPVLIRLQNPRCRKKVEYFILGWPGSPNQRLMTSSTKTWPQFHPHIGPPCICTGIQFNILWQLPKTSLPASRTQRTAKSASLPQLPLFAESPQIGYSSIMITPRFTCSQKAESVIISVYCPSIRVRRISRLTSM